MQWVGPRGRRECAVERHCPRCRTEERAAADGGLGAGKPLRELFSRAALEMVLQRGIHSRAHFFQTEIKAHCRNLRIVEVPIHYCAPSPRLGTSALKDSLRQLRRLYSLRRAGQL